MGLSVNPIGKMKSIIQKIDNAQQREAYIVKEANRKHKPTAKEKS